MIALMSGYGYVCGKALTRFEELLLGSLDESRRYARRVRDGRLEVGRVTSGEGRGEKGEGVG